MDELEGDGDITITDIKVDEGVGMGIGVSGVSGEVERSEDLKKDNSNGEVAAAAAAANAVFNQDEKNNGDVVGDKEGPSGSQIIDLSHSPDLKTHQLEHSPGPLPGLGIVPDASTTTTTTTNLTISEAHIYTSPTSTPHSPFDGELRFRSVTHPSKGHSSQSSVVSISSFSQGTAEEISLAGDGLSDSDDDLDGFGRVAPGGGSGGEQPRGDGKGNRMQNEQRDAVPSSTRNRSSTGGSGPTPSTSSSGTTAPAAAATGGGGWKTLSSMMSFKYPSSSSSPSGSPSQSPSSSSPSPLPSSPPPPPPPPSPPPLPASASDVLTGRPFTRSSPSSSSSFSSSSTASFSQTQTQLNSTGTDTGKNGVSSYQTLSDLNPTPKTSSFDPSGGPTRVPPPSKTMDFSRTAKMDVGTELNLKTPTTSTMRTDIEIDPGPETGGGANSSTKRESYTKTKTVSEIKQDRDRRRSSQYENGETSRLQDDFSRLRAGKGSVAKDAPASSISPSSISPAKDEQAYTSRHRRDSSRIRMAAQFGDDFGDGEDDESEDDFEDETGNLDGEGKGEAIGEVDQRMDQGHQDIRSIVVDDSVNWKTPAVDAATATATAKSTSTSTDPSAVDWDFWGAVVNDYEEVARMRSRDLSKAIQKGIPAVIRGTIWQLMSSSKSHDLEAVYSALLRQPSAHEKAIRKDIQRTFPSHSYFQRGGVGEGNLFNVLKAYSLYDPDVGYTQGIGFIVAAFLLNMPDEEAFCVLVRLMQSYDLRSQFLPEMPGLQLRLFQFDRLLEELLPVLHRHLIRIGIKSSVFAQWFLTLFAYRFPLSLVYRIFDIILAEGTEAIFRFALAIMAKNEDHFLELNFEGVLHFLQNGVFDVYKHPPQVQVEGASAITTTPATPSDDPEDEHWDSDTFVNDAYMMKITPFMLDTFAVEWQDSIRQTNATATEIDSLRNSNRALNKQVKALQSNVSSMNAEHVQLINQLVNLKVEKEEVENELIRYKVLYAELAHQQQESMGARRMNQ